jgi:hypothetical protein
VDGAHVSGRFFEMLRVPAMRGRMLTPADDAPGTPDARWLSSAIDSGEDTLAAPMT